MGRHRISNILSMLGIFLSPSAIRNILIRPRPRNSSPASSSAPESETLPRKIPAWYPNHVWSVDMTVVGTLYGLKIYVLMAVDHFSRRAMCALPLEGPNAGRIIDALEKVFECMGMPKHVITDQEGVFGSDAFRFFLKNLGIRQRFGAVGKHGSISVTERLIKTLKYEWLFRAPVIRGFTHLTELCRDFVEWYNEWRPHMTLNGLVPDDVFYQRKVRKPLKTEKDVPDSV